MPHDSHGQLIEPGDSIVAPAINRHGQRFAGVVISMKEGQTCSGCFSFMIAGRVDEDYFDAEDAMLVLKANGELPLASSLGDA